METKTEQGLYTSTYNTTFGTWTSNNSSITSTIFTDDKYADGGPSSTYMQRLELRMYKQSIRIIQLENKLDSEECENLKKMLESNDEASVILAKEIIDNLEIA